MSFDPATFRSRVLAVGLLGVLLLVLWSGVVEPVVTAFDEQSAAIDRDERLLIEFGRRTAPVAALEARLGQIKEQQGSQIGLFEAATPATSGAALQGAARRLFEAQGGALRTAQVLPVSVEEGLRKISVRIDAAVPANRLPDLLYEIDGARPFLFADNVEFRVSESGSGRGIAGRHAEISVRADLYGYMRAAGP